MTPRAYETARRMAEDPRTPKHERETAALRVKEYEARHGKPAPASTLGRPLFGYWHQQQAGAAEHDMRDLCATCGKDWALHWMAPHFAGMNVREEARTCGAFVPKMKAPRRPARPGVSVPWWTLDVSNTAGGKRMGITYAFRCALRHLRAGIEQPRERGPWTLYIPTPETIEHIERGEVDWRWFPEVEHVTGSAGWRPPPEMRAAMKARRT